jgi:hypothetical protein
MKRIIFTAIFSLVVSASLNIYAEESPAHGSTFYQLSLSHPVQLFPKEADVNGFRLNFFRGINHNVSGFDTGNFNIVWNNAKGLQFGFLQNMVHNEMKGIQLALGDNDAGSIEGIQMSLCLNNIMRTDPEFVEELGEAAKGDVSGVQMTAGFNYGYSVQGIQLGFLSNVGTEVQGVQFGLINYSTRISGVQIGVINCIDEGGFREDLPIINFGFDFLFAEEEETTEESDAPEKEDAEE